MLNYRLADTVIALETVRPGAQELLKGYRTDEEAEYVITTSPEDIEEERERSEEKSFGDRYYELLAVHRKLSRALLAKDVLLFHGSALAMDGAGYVFAAPSGTGKSTHARLWRERFGGRVTMVNDDKPYLGIGRTCVTVYGSPWDGKHRLSTNTAAPLKAIAVIERAERNRLERMEPSEAVSALLQQSYRAEELDRIFPLVLRLAELVPVYKLRCNMDIEAADVAYEGMR